MESERLLYRSYTQNDLHVLHGLLNESSRRRWFYFQEPDCLTLEFAQKIIDDNMKVWSGNVNVLLDHCGFGIVLKETNELIGNVDLVKCRGDEVLDYVNIGYQIGESFQGKGYATEAVKAAVDWGFEKLLEQAAEQKIIGDVEHENWASRRVLEKAGFTFIRAEQYVSIYEMMKP